MEESIVQMLLHLLPAVVVGIVAFYFFNLHTKNEEQRRKFLLHKEAQNHTLPIRLQAYERMVLFLERMAPSNLVVRIKPFNSSKEKYASQLTSTIEQEFEHNLAQQIYVSDECWNVIKASKNATINNIRKTAAKTDIKSADELREHILSMLLSQQSASETALLYVKKEVSNIW